MAGVLGDHPGKGLQPRLENTVTRQNPCPRNSVKLEPTRDTVPESG
jgi:hypothetical protein